jgi:type I restriction enzyme, R subunit
MSIAESEVEDAAIEWFRAIGYEYVDGPMLAVDGIAPERRSWQDVILEGRLRRALTRINGHLSADLLDDVAKRVMRPATSAMEENNLAFHRMLTKGVDVELRKDGATRGDQAWIVDFDDPEMNDWLVVNQLTVVGDKETRRPDMVVYLNGIPMAVIELKNPEDQNATIESAWNQLQTYKQQIPQLFDTNELLLISDGIEARVGSLTAGFERFGPWRTVDGKELVPESVPKLKVLIEGLFDKRRLLDYLRNFIFCETQDGFVKKVAGYHQYWAVNKAVEATRRASSESGDQRVGVVWHTQGSGKSVSMVFYAGKIIRDEAMANPTLVVLTDRNDLDGQLHAQFAAAPDLVPDPVQAQSRDDLRELLQVASGGVIFTTLQKFGTMKGERMPELSDRHNIIVIADEAHRSHYAFVEGFARNLRDALPHASLLGFTGTPIEFDDKSTPAVFGDYIDTYTISQAVEDGATVRILYEARLAKIALPDDEKPRVDEDFEEVTEGEEDASKEKLKSTWARIEALVGTEKRLSLIAQDIVDHWDRRTEILDGKAMVVCMSRRICADLYKQIVELMPEWHSDEDDKGVIKVVMTGSASDDPDLQVHIRSKKRQKAIEKRFKDPEDSLRIVLVRDMWLTGFDVPCLHTLYLDKPMKGHTLMQAIARVNRVFRDKPAGLVVDYLGLAEQLGKAVGSYGGKGGGGGGPGIDIDLALRVLIEKFEIVKDMYHGFDSSGYFTTSAAQRVETLAAAADHILGSKDGKKRYLDAMAALNKAAGIALHMEGARFMRDDVGFFQGVESNIRKYATTGSGKTRTELNAAIRQILSEAVSSEGVIDVFAAAGLATPDISILSDEFLQTVQKSPHRNLQIELLQKLLNDEIRSQSRQNVVQARRFSELLERTLNSYQNRTLEAAQVILELIELAKEMRDAPKRGEALGLTHDEMAFYDALTTHGNVRDIMGDKVLAAIAHDLVTSIRSSVSIDWTKKESVRARMRSNIKRLLRKHGYPPDKREEAVVTVLDQAEVVCREWGEVA